MRGETLLAFGLLAAATCAAAPLRAQDSDAEKPSAKESGIVVTGEPEVKNSTVRGQARRITRQPDMLHESLARYRAPICPGVIGLPPNLAILMVERILYNAGRVGLDVAKSGGCRLNILVAFVRDGAAQVAALKKHPNSIFYGLSFQERREVMAQPGPARSWNVVVRRTRDGMPAGYQLRLNSASRVRLSTRQDIELSVVVFDYAGIDGLSVSQLADYVTMRAFTRTREPSDPTSYGTILNLFSPVAAHPGGLTQFDVAYLTAVNSSTEPVRAVSSLAKVPKLMRKQSAQTAKAEAADGE